jgi:hypothetical protein
MFTNRISRFFVDVEPARDTRASTFAVLPAFAVAQVASTNLAAPSIYQLAWEQAQKQVEAKRSREKAPYDWN